jgi:hypothetical protein
VGATHTPYSDHIDRNLGILRCDWADRSGKRQCRDHNSSYHATIPGAPLQHHYKSGRSVTADRGLKTTVRRSDPLPSGRQLVTLKDAGTYITTDDGGAAQSLSVPIAAALVSMKRHMKIRRSPNFADKGFLVFDKRERYSSTSLVYRRDRRRRHPRLRPRPAVVSGRCYQHRR